MTKEDKRQATTCWSLMTTCAPENPGLVRHVVRKKRKPCQNRADHSNQVSPRGFEPLTFGSGGRRSIQLSYGDSTFKRLWAVTRESVKDRQAARKHGTAGASC